jgi:hypothetical protein
MKRAVILLVAAMPAGCMAMVPDDMHVNRFEDVKDPAGFWVRVWEMSAPDEGINFAGLPKAFKECTGAEVVKMSPPHLTAAVDRFIADKNAGNLNALIPMVRKFSSGYEKAYGIKPGHRAGELCKDKLQA